MPSCTTFDTIDAWNIGQRRSEFGWALVVKVPETIPSIGWTIAIRVPLQSRGTFESWVSYLKLKILFFYSRFQNAAFHNVYEKDGELVFIMHAKWFYTDSKDRSSVVFIGSDLEKSDKRELFFFTIYSLPYSQNSSLRGTSIRARVLR